jgi:hypothetical protein
MPYGLFVPEVEQENGNDGPHFINTAQMVSGKLAYNPAINVDGRQ